MSFITNDDIIYIKHNIKRSVFKLIKRACDVKKKLKKHTHNIVYI